MVSIRILLIALVCVTLGAGPEAYGAELPLSLRVLNYQSFNGADLQSYMMRMKEQIRSRWHPAGEAPHAAKIFFQIFSDGSLLQHSVEESSGDRNYDDQAKTVIEGCAPFGSPPPGSVRLINIVATFGTESGAPSEQTISDVPRSPLSATNSNVGDSQVAADGGTSARPPLQGGATETGVLQSAASSEGAPHFLQGEVGASGQYAARPLQGLAMAAPPQPPMFQPQIATMAPFQGGAQQQQPGFYQSQVEHGEMTVGVLGCEFGLLNNQIRQIMPGSDLLRYGIQSGDVIEAADGQALRGKAMQAYIRGTPGTYVQLTLMHRGQLITVPVQRKDARMFTNYNGYFKKWAAREKFW